MSQSQKTPSRIENLVRVAVVLAMVGAVAVALLLPLGVKDASKVTKLLGRFHILALHVPIGVLAVALTAEAATFLRRGRRIGDVVVGFALPMLVLTGFAAIMLGLMLGHSGHYPNKLVAPHRNLTILGILIAGVARLLWMKRRSRWLHRGLLGASAGAMTIGAHFGGSMTHGADFLTASIDDKPSIVEDGDAGTTIAEEPDAGATALVPPLHDASTAIADAASEASSPTDAGPIDAGPPKPTPKQVAQGIVYRRCAPCHTTNQKGGLRMTDVSKPTKKNVVVPGNPEASGMYTRLLLPKDDDDHMPPENEPQLTRGEIAAIRAFIADQK